MREKQHRFSLLWHALGRYRIYVLGAAAAIFVESVLELLIPFLMARIVDVGIPAANTHLIFQTAALMVLCAGFALVFGVLFAHCSAMAAMGLGSALREAQYAQIQRFSFANLDTFEASSLVTRMTSDVSVIQNATTMGFRPFMRGPIMLVMGLVLACTMSFDLAVVFFIVLPVQALVLVIIVKHTAPLYSKLQQATDRVNKTLQEDLTAIRATKAFVRKNFISERFAEVNTFLKDTATHTFRMAVLNTPLFQLSMYITSVALLWFGGWMIMHGKLQVGTLTSFMSYVLVILNSLMMISGVFLLGVRALTSVERISEVLSQSSEIQSPQTQATTSFEDASIEFKNVDFKYAATAQKQVLSDITLHIASGQKVGILGSTGSGKSSLIQLISRLYDVSSGAVYVGGHDVRSYDLDVLRSHIATTLQTNVLFSGTVRENLLWAKPDASDKELLEVCRLACVDEFLDRIGGLDAELGHGGSTVSGGQKQRLCIARTLLKGASIVIFDDSTSAVDMKTDAKIQQHLRELTNVTSLVIAQRVASVMDADKIIILDDGHVHAVGTHQDLIQTSKIYQELFASQMGSGMVRRQNA